MDPYTLPEWNEYAQRYYITQNAIGSYWPCMSVRMRNSDKWCPIIIRNSKPFKTLSGAIRFIERLRAENTL